MKAVLHSWVRKKHKVWGIAYGLDPYGPNGGTCGNVVSGRVLITRCGVGSFGSHAPQWMERAVAQLNAEQPASPVIEQEYGTGKFEIKDLEAEENATKIS